MTAIHAPALPSPAAARGTVRRLHLLLAVQSLLLVLASVNRLWSGTDAEVLPHGALRVVELLNLFVLAPLSALAFYGLLELLLTGVRSAAARLWLRLGFLAALYLFAVSYGIHEPANYLHARFCADAQGSLCRIVGYQDDDLSHLVFFLGLAGIDAVLLAAQAAAGGPLATLVRGRDRALVVANAALVAAAIVANLGFEEIGLDMVVVALVAALALALLRRFGARPLILYFACSYAAGLLVTGAVRVA